MKCSQNKTKNSERVKLVEAVIDTKIIRKINWKGWGLWGYMGKGFGGILEICRVINSLRVNINGRIDKYLQIYSGYWLNLSFNYDCVKLMKIGDIFL